jgi:hypothetical protein
MITIKVIAAIVILLGLNGAASAEGAGSGQPPAQIAQPGPEQGSER